MKHLAARFVVSLVTFAIGIASFGLLRTSRPVSNVEDELAILRMERQYIQANLDGDTATLDSILADEFVFKSRRRAATKADRLAMFDDPNFSFEAINTDNVAVWVKGDSATVTGEAFVESRRYDELFTSPRYSFTRNYKKTDGRWQIVSVIVGK